VVYLLTPAFTRRLADPLACRRGSQTIADLTVSGPDTGDLFKVRVIAVHGDRNRYPFWPLGEPSWVRGLRAASAGELSSTERTEAFSATEVPASGPGLFIAGHRQVARSY
jgi:hypothetical protein